MMLLYVMGAGQIITLTTRNQVNSYLFKVVMKSCHVCNKLGSFHEQGHFNFFSGHER